jgi:hypothetical protein
MLKKKKANIWSTLQGLIIFAVLLVAVIIFIRSISQEAGVDKTKTIREFEQAIIDVSQHEGTLRHRLEIGENSAIIAYAANKDAIILNANFLIPKTASAKTQSEFKGNVPGNLFEYKQLLGYFSGASTSQAYERSIIPGFIKEKAPTCAVNEACICYCEDISLETIEISKYNWKNAYLTCKREQCITIEQNKVPEKTYLKQFFQSIDPKYRTIKDETGNIYNIQTTPDIDTIQWDGGYIIMRTDKEIGTECVYMKHGETLERDCNEVFAGQIFELRQSDWETFIVHPTIAGYRRNLVMRYMDIELENKNGIITPRLI